MSYRPTTADRRDTTPEGLTASTFWALVAAFRGAAGLSVSVSPRTAGAIEAFALAHRIFVQRRRLGRELGRVPPRAMPVDQAGG